MVRAGRKNSPAILMCDTTETEISFKKLDSVDTLWHIKCSTVFMSSSQADRMLSS